MRFAVSRGFHRLSGIGVKDGTALKSSFSLGDMQFQAQTVSLERLYIFPLFSRWLLTLLSSGHLNVWGYEYVLVCALLFLHSFSSIYTCVTQAFLVYKLLLLSRLGAEGLSLFYLGLATADSSVTQGLPRAVKDEDTCTYVGSKYVHRSVNNFNVDTPWSKTTEDLEKVTKITPSICAFCGVYYWHSLLLY